MDDKVRLYLIVQTRNSDLKIVAIVYAVDDEDPSIISGREDYILSKFNDVIRSLKKEGFSIVTYNCDLGELLYKKAKEYDYRATRDWIKEGEVVNVSNPEKITPLKGSLVNREEIYNQCVKKLEELRKQTNKLKK